MMHQPEELSWHMGVEITCASYKTLADQCRGSRGCIKTDSQSGGLPWGNATFCCTMVCACCKAMVDV